MAKEKSFFTSTPFIVAATGVTAVAGYFGYRAISNKIKERKQENAGNQVDNKDPKRALATTYAQKAFTAFFPSGTTWMPDGTNEQALYEVAKGMFVNKVPFAYVTEAYRKLYSRSFVEDLTDELDAEELTIFYNKQKGLGNPGAAPIKKKGNGVSLL